MRRGIPLLAMLAQTDVATDPAKLAKCRNALAASFGKAEQKPPCATTGEAATVQALVDAFVDEVTNALTEPDGTLPFQHQIVDGSLGGFLDDMNADGTIDVVIRGHFGPTTLVVGANWQGPPVELWENLTVP